MSSSFIRGLWGVPDFNTTDTLLRIRAGIADELINWKAYCPSVPFKTYAYGKDNCEVLAFLGIDYVKLSDEPVIWDNSKYMHRHKIEIVRKALDDFNEIVWLDWDCQQRMKIPTNFWEKASEGQPFLACLKRQKCRHCRWRTERENQKFFPSGGVMYMRGKETADHAIDCWLQTGMNPNDEIAYAKMSDELLGGWQGPDAYSTNFEPLWATTRKCGWCSPEIVAKKKIIFRHRS